MKKLFLIPMLLCLMTVQAFAFTLSTIRLEADHETFVWTPQMGILGSTGESLKNLSAGVASPYAYKLTSDGQVFGNCLDLELYGGGALTTTADNPNPGGTFAGLVGCKFLGFNGAIGKASNMQGMAYNISFDPSSVNKLTGPATTPGKFNIGYMSEPDSIGNQMSMLRLTWKF